MRASTWRDRDLGRVTGPAPASVTTVVRRTYLALRAARVGESLLLGIGAGMLALAALALDGGETGRREAWAMALVPGGLCAATWLHAQRRSALEIARQLDRRLRHQGGLLTAYELEQRGERGPMARLVVARVLVRLRSREALRAMFPSLALPVAAPILGISLLAFAVDRSRPEPKVIEVAGLAFGASEVLDEVEQRLLDTGERGALEPELTGELLGLARSARDLRRQTDLGREDPQKLARALDEMEQRLSRVSPQLAPHPELRGQVEDARNWIDAARMELERAGAVESPPGMAGTPGGPGQADPTGGMGAGAGSQTDGQASSPNVLPSEAATASTVPSVNNPEDSGTVAGGTWPTEYDGVVAGWIESRRRASARRREQGK